MIYELDPVEAIAVAAMGEPGHRQFFLMASGQGRTLTLSCEKAQIQALIVRLHQMLDAQGIDVEGQAASARRLQPGEPEWQVAEMGLGCPPSTSPSAASRRCGTSPPAPSSSARSRHTS